MPRFCQPANSRVDITAIQHRMPRPDYPPNSARDSRLFFPFALRLKAIRECRVRIPRKIKSGWTIAFEVIREYHKF
jgi:hypothetical protein